MALTSMTGFGRGEASADGLCVEVELSSVNRKQFDLRLSLPRALQTLESRAQSIVHDVVARGSINGTVKVGACEGVGVVRVDVETASAYLRELRRVACELDLKDDLTARSLTALPGVVQFEAVPQDSDRVWPLLEKALKQALHELVVMRKTEGAVLHADVDRRLTGLRRPVEQIQKLAPGVPMKHARALRQRLSGADVNFAPDDAQLARELALFADRSDISEELVRLDSHFKQAAKLLGSRGPVGRALDFLCQEMFREINTIGSKANDAGISRHVIRFKAELETVREQVQNVE